MDAKLLQAVRTRMEGSPTDELLRLWTDNDRECYSEEAFEAARLILTNRDVVLPPQREWTGRVPIVRKATNLDLRSESYWMLWLTPILWIAVAQGALGTIYQAVQIVSMIRDETLREMTLGSSFSGLVITLKQWLELLLPPLLLVSAAGCLALKPLFRTALLTWVYASIATEAISLLTTLVLLVTGASEGPLLGLRWIAYQLYSLSYAATFPAVVLFILTRPQIKRLFDAPSQGFDISTPAAVEHAPQDGS